MKYCGSLKHKLIKLLFTSELYIPMLLQTIFIKICVS